MYTVKLQDQVIDFEKIDEACHYIPSGMNVWEGRMERFDLTQLKCYRSLKDAKRLERSLGTLGGGNHFIEVDRAKDGTYYLVIHSGSRNLGKQVAEIYQQLAIDLHTGKEEYFKKRDEIIRTYKEQGRRAEIQEALKHLKKNYEIQELDAPNDICWLYGSFMDDYLHDVEICQRFARRSRERMAEIIIERTKMTRTEAFHTIHNYIDVNEMILRKGAIAAHAGEKILIPINMRDGSVLAVGKGNVEWNNSAPHGAGRIMSRTKAKQSIDLEEYKASMQGIYSTSVNADTLDEAPMAYKSLADIIDVIRDSVEIIDIMKPVYNFKAFKLSDRSIKNPNIYPYNVFHRKDIDPFIFAPITVLYGNNGSGKSTILNIIANKLMLTGKEYATSNSFGIVDYCGKFLSECQFSYGEDEFGKELMSQDEIAVMDGGKCILQLRGVRPFFSDKFDITKHPKYKYLSDADPKNAFDMEKHLKRRPAIVKPDEVFDYYEIDAADLQ